MAAFSLHQFVSAVLVIAKPNINAGRLRGAGHPMAVRQRDSLGAGADAHLLEEIVHVEFHRVLG